MKTQFFVFLVVLFSAALHAQRLPEGVLPEHYQLTFTPDLQSATFSGDEVIDVRLAKPTSNITLSAAEIKFASVTIESRGATQTARITRDEDREQVSLIAPNAIAAGPARLHIVFTGILNDKLRGFYLSKTAKRRYAVTQFEPTDARRAFPCFDEPDKKATFDITLIVDKGDTAISNEKLLSDTPGPADNKHTLKFATTKKLSTYLIAMLIGDFQCLEGSVDGTPIRACATPDKKDQTQFALEAEQYVLHYYNEYFGIPYPFGKLDLIAVPDFEAGAMENAGAITYRESDMLLDPKVATVDNYERVASVVAHETAHQWFGDLVTMKWWDDLWLNEGFATWMESRPVGKWKPEWHEDLGEVLSTNETLELDALKTTRPIRQKAETPDEINELFDGIAYGKAAAVLRMVESYVGPELFRKGVQNYLREHSYGNAKAEDFWNAVTRASGKPADKIMSSFVIQAGEPLLRVSEGGGQKALSQERMFSDHALMESSRQAWNVPACFRPITPTGNEYCTLLSARSQITNNPDNTLFFANADGHGYYRTEYERDTEDQLTKQLESGVQPAERIFMLGDEWALMRVGRLPIGKYLDLVSQLKGERLRPVWQEAFETLDYIYAELANDQERGLLRQFVRNLLKPVYAELANTSDPEEKELRADIFYRLGIIGRDPDVMAEARQIADKALQDPASTDASLAGPALEIASIASTQRTDRERFPNGDPRFFNRIAQKLKATDNQDLRRRYMDALSRFEDPDIEEKALELGVSGAIPNQDSTAYLSRFLRDPATRNTAWKFFRTHWDDVAKTFTTSSGGYLVAGAGNFCSADAASQVSDFFRVHPVPASERTLRQALERINSCTDLRKMQETSLQSWLADHTGSQSASAGTK
jgi:aminopeptidase N/puromycin-sensitive aminopeptidase